MALLLLSLAQAAGAATYYWNRNAVLINDRDFNKAYNWTANQNGTGAYIPSDKDDDFTNDALNSIWTVRDQDNDAGTGANSLAANADQLTITARGADIWGATNQFYALHRLDIRGNFDLTVKITSQTNTAGHAKAGIIVANDITNLANGGYCIMITKPSGAAALECDVNGNMGELETATQSGAGTFPVWLRLVKSGTSYGGYYKRAIGDAWTNLATYTPQGAIVGKQNVGLVVSSGSAAGTGTVVMDDFQGGGRMVSTGHDLSGNGTGGNADASAVVSSDATAASLDLTGYSGTLSFGGQNGLFATAYDNVDFTGTSASWVDSTVNVNYGQNAPGGLGTDSYSIRWEGYVVPQFSETYTFYTNCDDGTRLWVNNSLIVDDWTAHTVIERTSSTLALTAGTRYPITLEYFENVGDASCQLKWSSASQTKQVIPKQALVAGRIAVTGNANMGTTATLTAADGALEFSGPSGTQVLTVRSAQTHPTLIHSGASTLQLASNALTTTGFEQSAGTLDLNSLNLTTVAGTGNYRRGDFAVWSGGTSSFANLGGRTLTIAGNASFTGTSGTNLNMNPGSSWTLAVTGSLNARFASIGNCNASVTAGVAHLSTSSGSNSNWTISGNTFFWNRSDALTSNTDFNKAYNWSAGADGGGIRPVSAADDWFDGNTLGASWTFRDQDGEEDKGSYRLSGGQLILTGDGGDVWGTTNEYVVAYRGDITGDFDVSVRVVSTSNSAGTGHKVGLIMADDFTNLGSGGYAKVNFQGSGKVEFSRAQTVAGQLGSNTDGGSGLTLPLWLRMAKSGTTVTAYYRTSEAGTWTQVGTGQTPTSTAANSQIGLFVCGGSGTATAVFDQFQGGTNMTATDNVLDFSGTASGADANATLSASVTTAGIDFTDYSGTFNFGSSTLTVNSGPTVFVSTMGVTPGTGALAFGGSGQYGFWPKSGVTFPPMTVNGMTLYTPYGAVVTSSMTVNSGQWLSGNGVLTHQVGSLSMTGGSVHFGSNTIQVTSGNASFTGGSLIYWTGGTLGFTGTSGTQVFTPLSGATHPHITKSGAGTLQLAANDLTALSYTQTAGVLDFNGRNITTTSSGDFSITNGTTTTLTNLGGRTITVAGKTLLSGQSGNLLNLNPGSAWTIASTGTLTARYATIMNSTASLLPGVPYNSTNGGTNTNWNFNSSDFSAWSHSTRIAFNTTSTGANVSGNVNNFPFLIRLNANNFIFSQAKSDGSDIRFQDPDGTSLNFYIERWDATTKLAEIWVRVPQVDGNSAQDYIRMYWGNGAATAMSSGSSVFPEYKGVWHLGESPGAAAPQFTDASGNANHGTAQGGATGDSVTAAVGKGWRLNGSSKYMSSTTSFTIGDVFTIGVWFRTVTQSGGWIIGRQQNQTGGTGGHDRKIYMADNGRLFFGVYPGSNQTINSTSSYNDGAWHQAVARLSTAGMQLFVDGTQVATNPSITTAEGQTGYWQLGFGAMGGWSSAPTSNYFAGTLDAAMATHTSLSADQIKLAYETQKPASTVARLENTGLSTWGRSTKVYINTTASGANITTTQSNYPLLVRLTNANFDFSQALPTGADIRFADSAGNLLPYEIERWNASSKLAEVWVLVPTVQGNNNSQWIRMYWGKGDAASLSSGPAVFLGSAGYVGVYHLNEDGNTTASGYKDASNAENHGTGINFDNATDLPAVVGLGSSFATAANQGIHIAHHASQAPTAALTVQAWFYNYSFGAYRRIVNKPFSSESAPWNQYGLEVDDAGDNVSFTLNLAGTEGGLAATTTMSLNTWYHAAGVYDGSTQRIYFNGVQEASTARSGSIANYSQNLAIGKYALGTGSNWDGIIDEVRISSVARSADWMKLDYETMKAGSAVVTVGERSADYSKSVQLAFNTTASGADVAGNVTDIPILVRLSAANFDFAAARNDAADLKFVDKDGTPLYHEVSEWDKANRIGKVWVKVPQVDGNSTADFITLYYGCAGCAAGPYARPDSVWRGFAGVWHLRGGDSQAYDATATANHGVYSNDMAQAPGITSALVPSFDGVGSSVLIANHSALDAENMTVSFWVKALRTGGTGANWWDPNRLVERDMNGVGNAGWAVGWDNAGTDRLLFVARDNSLLSNASVGTNTWKHVTLVKTATDKYIYVDGVLDNSEADAGVISNDESIGLMWDKGTKYASGQMAEFTLAGSARSADWIKLFYQGQKEGGALLANPITTASFTGSKVFKFNTTSTGANVAGDVYDFPLLLRFTDATLIDATQGAGQDIRFLDGDGVTWLDYRIERWDQAANLGEIWVKVPKVDGNSTSDFITMYYDDVPGTTLPDGQCTACVFPPGAGFVAAWPLNDNAASPSLQELRGAHAATSYSGGGSTSNSSNHTTAGIIGSAFNFDGNDHITLPTATGAGSAMGSASLWFKTSTDFASPAMMFYGSASSGGDGFGGENELHLGLSTSELLEFWSKGPVTFTSGSSYNNGGWNHAFLTWDRNGTATAYVNGAQVGSTAFSTAVNFTFTSTFNLGKPGSNSRYFTGAMDAVFLHNVVRSADWVKLAYETQRAAPTLFNPSPADFVSSRKYTFNTTRTGANVMGDVSNFPLLVRITGSTMVDAVQNDYDDIRFLDGDGKTWLDYQVERWDKTNDVAEVWVLVPKVDGNSDRDGITLYYNDVTDGAVGSGQCATCVFSTSNGFAGVWHLNNAYTDATANANTGTNNNVTATTGIIGQGGEFNGTSAYVQVADHASLNPTTAITVSAWANSDSWSGANRRILQKNTTDDQYILKDESDQLEFYTRNASDHYTRSTLPSTGAWHHYVGTWDGANRVIYVDGVAVATEAATGNLNTTAGALFIGTKSGSGDYFDGKLDEVRVASAARSADWVKLEYESQRSTGNVFWNARPGPNNMATLTASDAGGRIALSWTSTVTDSANADSLGLWVRYSGPPDSVGAASQTKVALLPKTDSAYSYPATYPGTYYFGLAVRNSAGKWSPFTAASIDTVVFGGNAALMDTVYADSAIGSDSYTCLQARSPFTPKLSVLSAAACQTDGITDTLVIRVMPGTYTDGYFVPSAKPIVAASFDPNSRAVISFDWGNNDGGARSSTWFAYSNSTLRNLDFKCYKDGNTGIYIWSTSANVRIEGCRIYNKDASTRHSAGIHWWGNGNNNIHVANNLIHQPTGHGIDIGSDNSYNVVNNVIVGIAAPGARGINMYNATAYTDMAITNNILYNWDYGIYTASANVGLVSSNLFHQVTSGRELTNETDNEKIIRDPLFYSINPADRHAFKPLPGSPAIDAGTSAYGTGGEACPYRSVADMFGTSRPQGGAYDIGLYEGSGFTPNPAGEFDTLTNTVSGNTVIVKNSKWKLVWDMARGAGINGFYDMSGDTTVNLLVGNSLLFDVKVDAYQASAQTGNTLKPILWQRSRTRSIVRQRLAVSASQELVVWYTVHASGHVYIQSEIQNLSSGALAVGTVDYILKVSTATASSALSEGTAGKNGFGYLLTATRDAFLSVTQDLDAGAAGAAETWDMALATGATGTMTVNTADLVDIPKGMSRQHHFLLYVGDGSLDLGKASALNADAYSPSVVTTSAGSLLHERSWQDNIFGHWTLDDGAGTSAKDKSILGTNHATLTSTQWVSGKVGGALRFTTSSVGTIADHADLEADHFRTFMFWVKPDFAAMGNTAYLLSKGLTTSDGWYFRKVAGQNQIQFVVGAASVTSPTLSTGTWTHVAGVISGGSRTLLLYVDGVLVGASSAAATTTANASSVLLGKSGADADAFAGDLDDVRIYKSAIPVGQIQAVHRRGFSTQYGHYNLRADNNNRVVALLNESGAATRVQPAFQIDNWYGPKTPKYVYLNGVRLMPNVDFTSDSVWYVDDAQNSVFGITLLLQVNKVLTGASQTLFVDDDDSTGYLGEAARMKSLSITATADDKIAIQNFSGTTFGNASSGQWYMELDLNGWSPTPAPQVTDKGFGAVNVWKAAGATPDVAISSGTNLVGQHGTAGRMLSQLKFDATGAQMMDGALGYTNPANISYTLMDSSSTRLSLVTTTLTSTAEGTVTFTKRWTFYPTGRIFGSIAIATSNLNLDAPFLYTNVQYQSPTLSAWGDATALANARYGLLKGNPGYHAIGTALLSIRSAGATTTAPGSMLASAAGDGDNTGSNSYKRSELRMQTSLFQSADVPVTLNFMHDFSKNFADSATADSLLKDAQTPAAITALTGTATTNDALDFNGDAFAEGDGAYIYTASGAGIAHFKFVNTVTHFNPAFRIKSWSYATLPEFVIVDQQTLVKDYHYNAYVNTATSELILQFNKTFHPGTHVFYVSQKTGLAVKLNRFEAIGGEGVDTLRWTTESEFENLGFNVYRRVAPAQDLPEVMQDVELTPGAGIANALLQKAKAQAAAKAAAALKAAAGDTTGDTLPELTLSPEELKALGYVKINPKLLPGAEGGASSSTRDYLFIDRSAAYGTTYEYLLEAVDFNGARTQYGPRTAKPDNPLETALLPNYPNPFNPVTNLRFSLKEVAKVSLVIYDGRGRVVRTLLNPDKPLQPGKYRLTWDARDDSGFEVPSGQYFYRFTVPKYTKTRKMILVK